MLFLRILNCGCKRYWVVAFFQCLECLWQRLFRINLKLLRQVVFKWTCLVYWNAIFKKYNDIFLIFKLWEVFLTISGWKSILVHDSTAISVMITLGNYFISNFGKYVILFIVFYHILAIVFNHIAELLRHFFFQRGRITELHYYL